MDSAWNTIESDAGVFTSLIEQLGATGVEFEELLSIDSDSLRAVGPLYGVIFLFKYRASEMQRSIDTGTGQPLDGIYDREHNVFFARQIINNACATQAMLSVLLNAQPSHPEIDVGPELAQFRAFVGDFDAELKGEAISNSEAIRTVHNSFSRPTPFVDGSQDHMDRDENDDGLYHFIAYVPVHGVLYELDGLHPYPINHGPCEDLEFADKLPEVLARRIARSPEGELRFNLIALTRDKRLVAQETGDQDMLAEQLAKRSAWDYENTLRKENFVGLIHCLVKSYAHKASDEQWKQVKARAVKWRQGSY